MTRAPCLDAGASALWLKADDGIRLRVVVWPQAAARGTVMILTGRTEHAEKYAATARDLNAAGFAVAAIDWRGQGLSERLTGDPRKGHVGDFADYQRDLASFGALVRAELPGPLFLLGHSMGGCIGLRGLINGFSVRAAAFSAPMWGIKVPGDRNRLSERLAWLGVRAGMAERYAPPPASGAVSPSESGPFDGNTLTSDLAEWDHMQAELRAHPELVIAGPTLGWTARALTECRTLAALPAPALPCLTAVGSEERIVLPAAIEARMAAWPGGHLLPIPGARHELLMETPALRQIFLDAAIGHFAAHCD